MYDNLYGQSTLLSGRAERFRESGMEQRLKRQGQWRFQKEVKNEE
jgi:hypothetical protein